MINLKKFYPIQTWLDNKILRKKSKTIDSIDQDILEFAEILMELMYEYDWVWLAAPQIWRNVRMIAITYWKETKKGHERIDEDIMINPEIIEKSNEMLVSEEACLSVPDVIWKVKRHQNIVVEYLDIFGRKKKKKLRNYNACIVQHEIDHLDAILFVDKLIK
jgi:peptide deformylase